MYTPELVLASLQPVSALCWHGQPAYRLSGCQAAAKHSIAAAKVGLRVCSKPCGKLSSSDLPKKPMECLVRYALMCTR